MDEGCAGKPRRYLHTCILVGRRRRSKIIIKKFVRNDNIDTKISASRYSHIIFQQPRVRNYHIFNIIWFVIPVLIKSTVLRY